MLKSRPGEGTRAELWLPAADEAPRTIDRSRLQPAEVEKQKVLLTVLAVDDDDLVLTNTVAMLEDLGHTAVGTSSGSAALEVLRDQSFDLVITDQVMPQMTGLELAEAIKTEWSTLPVILATGFAEAPSPAHKFAKLAKPFTQAELAAVLMRVHPMPGKRRVLQFPSGNHKS